MDLKNLDEQTVWKYIYIYIYSHVVDDVYPSTIDKLRKRKLGSYRNFHNCTLENSNRDATPKKKYT